MFKKLVIAVFASIFLASSGYTAAGQKVQASVNTEEAAVRKFLLEEIERWNSNGPIVAERYTADSDYVSVNGLWIIGLADLTNKRDMSRLRDSKITLIDTKIRFIRPDVAIAHQTHDMSGKRGPNGEELPTERQLNIRVLVKERGKWIQTAFHNTIVRPVEPPIAASTVQKEVSKKVLAPASALSQTRVNLFAGTWNANLSKSKLHPNHHFLSATNRFEVSDDSVLLTFTGVNMAGKQESGTRKLHPDGNEYAIKEAPGVVEVTRWVDSRTLETLAKKDGKVIGEGTYQVSRDGKELTAQIKGIDGSGAPFEHVIVFDRESAQVYSEDEKTIRKLLLERIESFNRHEGPQATAYTADADFVNVYGMWRKGPAEIEGRQRERMQTVLKDAKITLIDMRIRFIRPDVAIIHQKHEMAGMRDAGGKTMPTHQELSVRVMVKEKGTWLTTAFHNTIVRPVEPPAAVSSQTGDVQARNKEVIRQNFEAINRGDVKAAAATFSEDMINFGRRVGREGIELTLTDIFVTFPDWRMEILEMVAEGDIVVARCNVSGTHRGIGRRAVNGGMLVGVPPTGKRFEVTHIHWYKMRDGKIAEHWANRNDLGMMQQLGLVPVIAAGSIVQKEVDDETNKLRAIERERLRSLVDADLATARRLHADDFQLINPIGGTLSKEQYLADIASGQLDYLEWEPGEIQVRSYGDSAVIRYQAHMRVSVKGSPGRPVTLWHTDLYEKRKGQWQIVWSQATQNTKTLSVETLGDTEKELIKLQNEWATARMKKDTAFLERLLAKEFRLISKDGSVVDREADIAWVTSEDLKIESIVVEEMKVSVYGDTAVVTGREKVKGSYKGVTNEFDFRFTTVFVRRDGRWQLVTAHGTPIPKTPSVPAIATEAVIKEWYRLLDKQDFDSWSSLFTEDSRNFIGSSNKSSNHKDIIPEVKKIYAAFPDFSHRIENVFACQDYGVAQVVMTGTHMKTFRGIAPTNNKVEFKETFIFKMKNGKIQETYGMTDVLTMMKQLGLELK